MGQLVNIEEELGTTKIEMSSFTGVTESNLQWSENESHETHTKLLQLIHFQELDPIVEEKGDGIESVTGAFDLVRWEELILVQTLRAHEAFDGEMD